VIEEATTMLTILQKWYDWFFTPETIWEQPPPD
jgi:hypothetical protein